LTYSSVNNFAGVQVDNITLKQAVEKVGEFLGSNQTHLIVTPNPEIIVACQKDQELKQIINNASLRLPDGISLVVVSKILGKPLKERVTGIDLMQEIIKVYGAEKKIYLLGGKPEVVEAAAKMIPNVVGYHHGYFQDSDDNQVVQAIKVTKPDILFVGLGAGQQERWINRHLKDLNVPVSMVIGGSLDVLSGLKKRAPKWIQKLYIEWLYRLITEPSRWKRQLALPRFLWLMFTSK